MDFFDDLFMMTLWPFVWRRNTCWYRAYTFLGTVWWTVSQINSLSENMRSSILYIFKNIRAELIWRYFIIRLDLYVFELVCFFFLRIYFVWSFWNLIFYWCDILHCLVYFKIMYFVCVFCLELLNTLCFTIICLEVTLLMDCIRLAPPPLLKHFSRLYYT